MIKSFLTKSFLIYDISIKNSLRFYSSKSNKSDDFDFLSIEAFERKLAESKEIINKKWDENDKAERKEDDLKDKEAIKFYSNYFKNKVDSQKFLSDSKFDFNSNLDENIEDPVTKEDYLELLKKHSKKYTLTSEIIFKLILLKKIKDLSETEVNYLHSLNTKEIKNLQWKHRLIELIIREDNFDSLSDSALYSLYKDAENIVELSKKFHNINKEGNKFRDK
uniref:Uncharacterized protein n=1 Tax=Clavaria fumosa TaxID=264083 RepID=A0A7T3PCT6_9AGAR|nr:hypothetical protein KQ422_mgp036 [Clavaria fumosa]QPZ51164.1 hypothetical protein [Clavaria fumosa]